MAYGIPEKYKVKAAERANGKEAVGIEWTGCAGFRLKHKGTTLLIDPFVTRPRMAGMVAMPLKCNEQLCAEVFPEADYILVGHSHYDHLLDVPQVASKTGALVFGSPSTASVCLGAGMPDEKVKVVETFIPIMCGPFKVTFIPGVHGKAVLGRIPFPGQISGRPKQPMRASHYRAGGVYGLFIEVENLRLYHLGSADLIDDETAKVGKVNALFTCLAGRQDTPNYVARLTGRLKPDYVIPHHYDDFFQPFKFGNNLMSGVDIDSFFDEVKAVSPGAKIVMPEYFQQMAFDPKNGTLIEGK
jgi:L-ascorbate metabolism protein UlaG (beta-lactamase superfamily)